VSLGKRKKEQEQSDRAAKRRETSFTCQTYLSVVPGEEVTVIVSAPYPTIAVLSHPVIQAANSDIEAQIVTLGLPISVQMEMARLLSLKRLTYEDILRSGKLASLQGPDADIAPNVASILLNEPPDKDHTSNLEAEIAVGAPLALRVFANTTHRVLGRSFTRRNPSWPPTSMGVLATIPIILVGLPERSILIFRW
jgi:hypothetical protein